MTVTPESQPTGDAQPAEHEWDERARQLTGEEDVSDVGELEHELAEDGKGPETTPAPVDPDAPGNSVLDEEGDAVEPNEPG